MLWRQKKWMRSMSQSRRGERNSNIDAVTSAKGLFKSISEGIRSLVVLDERLAHLGKENERSRSEVRTAVENLFRTMGKIEEMDKRLSERFSELDKRLSEFDKRIDMKVELSVRDRLERLDKSESNRVSVPPRHSHKS